MMRGNGLQLSLVLPAYNEGKGIQDVIAKSAAYLQKHCEKFEIIVVDDGSKDQTTSTIQSIQGTYPSLLLVRHPINKGYGEALRSGFNNAQLDWILLMDSDGQFDIEDLELFHPNPQEHKMYIGIRKNRADNFLRSFSTWGYVKLMNMIFGTNIRDFGCGFKLFRRDDWNRIQPIEAKDHKIFTVEWLWRFKNAGVEIHEVPVRHFPRRWGTPTGARWDVLGQMFKELIRVRFFSSVNRGSIT